MLIKLFGAVLIIIAGGSWGFCRAQRLAKREKSLIALQTALRILESEIVFSSNRLKQAFLNVEGICNCENLFSCAAENIENLGISDSWCFAADCARKKLCLTDSDVGTVKILASELGLSDREQQVKNIRHVSALLAQAASDAHSEYKTSAKLYRSMGILGGFFIVILLF